MDGWSTSILSDPEATLSEKMWRLSLLGLMAKIKCSICSYQFNIWYAGHSPAHILIWFLAFGQGSEVYLTLTTGCLGLALQPSAAHCIITKRSVPMKFHMYPSWRMAQQHGRAFSGSVLWKTPENLGILIFIFQIKILFSGKWSFLHISYTDTIRFSQKMNIFSILFPTHVWNA